MTKEHTYTVVTPVGTFTRTTARTYTHIVVCRRDYAAALERAGKEQPDDRRNFKYYVEQGAFPAWYTADNYIQESITARIEYVVAARFQGYYEPFAAAWCGRPDLADKEAAKWRGWGCLDVTVYPVSAV